jgi:hypothetical protein
MGRRRTPPRRDPPVRADAVAQYRPEPRRGRFAALAVFAPSLGAVADPCGGLTTAFAASSSNRCPRRAPLNALLDVAARRVEGDLRDHRYYPRPC